MSPRGGKPKVYDAAMVAEVSRLYAEGRTQTEVAKAIGVTQRVVWRLMVRHGIKARVAAKRDQNGAKNSTWGFSGVTYAAYHKRVEAARGRPVGCEECQTSDPSKTYDWACLTGRYDRIDEYKRMCRSCHWKFDGRIRNIQRSEVARGQ